MLKMKLIAFTAAVLVLCMWLPALAEDEQPIEATITIDAAKVVRTVNPRRLGGTNVAMWYFPAVYASTDVRCGFPSWSR